MKLEVLHGDRVIPVDLGELRRGRLQVDGLEAECDWVRISPRRISLILGGEVHDYYVHSDGEEWHVEGRGSVFKLRVRDPRRLAGFEPLEEGSPGRQRIHAEMPGKVMRVLVKQGDAVAYDQALLVLEAMKMQNEIRAPKSGIVREVGVEEGRRVSAGDFLLSLE